MEADIIWAWLEVAVTVVFDRLRKLGHPKRKTLFFAECSNNHEADPGFVFEGGGGAQTLNNKGASCLPNLGQRGWGQGPYRPSPLSIKSPLKCTRNLRLMNSCTNWYYVMRFACQRSGK